MRLDASNLGTARINPSCDVVAGEMGTWEIVYEVGKYGIDDTGSIRLAWRNPSDWGIPQFDNPTATGYTTASTNGNARIALSYDYFQRPYNQSILIRVYDGFLKEGDEIKVVLGDKSKGSNGIKAQTFMETKHEIKVLIDPIGSKRYIEIPEHIYFRIVPAQPDALQVIIPSTIQVGQEFDVLVRALDEYGNPSYNFKGEVELSIINWRKTDLNIADIVIFTEADKGVKRISGNRVEREGTIYIKAETADKKYKAISNGLSVKKENQFNLYWADMHGQTDYTVGTGSLDEYFTFARDVAAVDITGWQGNDFQIDDEKWDDVRAKTQKYYEPHKFVTFLGYEWSGLTPAGGDHNIYFLNDNESFYPSCNWLDWEGKTKVENNAHPISELWQKLRNRDDVMAIPHIGGRYGNLDYYNPDFISLIEVHSHHGTFEWFIEDAMDRRLQVGFVGASDDHTCRPGLSYPLSKDGNASSFDVASGFTAIYAENLTREGIWEALQKRRCYATTFNRMALSVKIDDHFMGEEIDKQEAPKIIIHVNGSAPIDNIKIHNWNEIIADINQIKKSTKKIRICWKGVRVKTRKKSTKWDGSLYVRQGKIVSAKEYAFDRADQGIKLLSNQKVEWTSNTSGDMDGLILEIEGQENTRICFTSLQKQFEINFKDITEEAIIIDAGGVNLQVEVDMANEEILGDANYVNACQQELTFIDKNIKEGLNAYWVKVTQNDGHMAWSSPIFVNYQK